MQKMSFWDRNKNQTDIKALSDTLAKNEDRALFKDSIIKNDFDKNKQEPFAEYKYKGFAPDNEQNKNGQMGLQEGLGLLGNIGATETSAGESTPWGAVAGMARTGYDTITGKDGKEYSDLEQSTIYPLQSTAIGSQFGPWGAAGGALYGLGYSLKDNLGLKDNNLLTDLLFPIGMGDEHQGLIQL